MKVLIARAKTEREVRKAQPCRVLEEAPENGLLVPELVEVARRVYQTRGFLLSGLKQLVRVIPVLRCEYAFSLFYVNIFIVLHLNFEVENEVS